MCGVIAQQLLLEPVSITSHPNFGLPFAGDDIHSGCLDVVYAKEDSHAGMSPIPVLCQYGCEYLVVPSIKHLLVLGVLKDHGSRARARSDWHRQMSDILICQMLGLDDGTTIDI